MRTFLLATTILAALALSPLASAHIPERILGTPWAVDNACTGGTCHTGVCWYGQFQPNYWECWGTWSNDQGVSCASGHWYWDLAGNTHYWCYA